MKKLYQKPQIGYESFCLTTDITASCSLIATNQNPGACPLYYKDWQMTLFTDAIACDTYPPEGDDSICYHVPSDTFNVFTS